MKKIILIMATAMLMFSTIACNNSTATTTNEEKETISSPQESTTEEATKLYAEYSDITFKGITKINNNTNSIGVIFVSSSDKAIKDIELYVALYDTDTMLIGSSYNTQKFESANIVKDKDKVYLLTPSSDKYSYADVVVGKIKYEDGSTWELENADEWIKYNTSHKDEVKQKYDTYTQKYGEYAKWAESNAAEKNITIDTEIVESVLTGYDVNMIVTNNSDKTIKALQVKCALFKGKKAASVPSISTISSIYAPSKDVAKYENYCMLFMGDSDGIVEPGETKSINNPQVLLSDDITIKTILYAVTWDDGTVEPVNGTTAWSAYNSYYRE